LTWKVRFRESARRDLERLDRVVQRRIIRFLSVRIATGESPKRLGKPLVGSFAGLWCYRVGDYRIICLIKETELLVEVVAVGHRKDIYD
jgi:mRNA interferase RelE/StbE